MVKKTISRFGLFVESLERAKSFYQKLGFNIVRDLDTPTMTLAFVQFEDHILELIEKKEELPFHRDGVLNHMTFDVDDIDSVVEEMTNAGATFFMPPTSLGTGKVAFAMGPSGEVIELFQE